MIIYFYAGSRLSRYGFASSILLLMKTHCDPNGQMCLPLHPEQFLSITQQSQPGINQQYCSKTGQLLPGVSISEQYGGGNCYVFVLHLN